MVNEYLVWQGAKAKESRSEGSPGGTAHYPRSKFQGAEIIGVLFGFQVGTDLKKRISLTPFQMYLASLRDFGLGC